MMDNLNDQFQFLNREIGLIRAMSIALSQTPSLIGRVFSTSDMRHPAGKYIAVHPVEVSGFEHEGSPGSLIVNENVRVYVLLVGPGEAKIGDDLICSFVENRWVTQKSKTNILPLTVPTPYCPCNVLPQSLFMSSVDPECMNGMFASDILRFVKTPDAFDSLVLGSFCFLSDGFHVDSDSMDLFRYHFACQPGFYTLSRVYETSVYGSPYYDIVRYSWPLPWPENSCSPFLLTTGFIFQGGNANCRVLISE